MMQRPTNSNISNQTHGEYTMQTYSDPTRRDDPYSLPNVEIFYLEDGEQTDEDGEGPDCWGWHAKDYAAAIRALK